MVSTIKVDKSKKTIEISGLNISNEVVFNYFNNLPANERDDKFLRAIYIGVLALM